MYKSRVSMYRELEDACHARVIAYVTGDRRNLQTGIASEVLDFIGPHLEAIGATDRICLFLYTRGGQTLAAWGIANLLRQYCQNLEVIVFSKAHSGGTLICLGADRIIMARHATLGPIDPSVNTPLNPSIPDTNQRYPVSVEAINGYIELAKQAGICGSADMASVLAQLTAHVHPLVLGEVYRTRSQIRMLGTRLLSRHMDDGERVEKILSFLCSESGSHDYVIFPEEARQDLGLNVDIPDDSLYDIVSRIHTSIADELCLGTPYEPAVELGQADVKPYRFHRALIESIPGGSDRFVSEGTLMKEPAPEAGRAITITDIRSFEGWRHESAAE